MTRRPWPALLAAAWLGLVVANAINAALKFRVVSRPVGLSIGRELFAAMAPLEAALALVALALLARQHGRSLRALWPGLALTLTAAVQWLVLLPPLDARAAAIIAGASPDDSALHWLYALAEAIKLALLVVLALRRDAPPPSACMQVN